jgi:hypothetical protein
MRRVEYYYDMVRKSLYLNTSEGVKSGEAIKMDYEPKYIKYAQITAGVLGVHKQLVYWFYAMQYPPVVIDGTKTISIPEDANFTYTIPSQYQIMSAEDLYGLFQKYNEANADIQARLHAKKEFYKKTYATDAVQLHKCLVGMEYDPLHIYTQTEVQSFLAQGIISLQDVQRRVNAVFAIEKYFNDVNNDVNALLLLPPKEIASRIK